MRIWLLFKKYSEVIPCGKDELCAAVQKALIPDPLIRYNQFWHGKPYVLYGECGDDSFHLAANGNMFNAFIPVIRGRIERTENGECRVKYRLIPNLLTILVSALFLIGLIAFHLSKGAGIASIAKALLFSALFVLIIFVVSCVSSYTEMEEFSKLLKARE